MRFFKNLKIGEGETRIRQKTVYKRYEDITSLLKQEKQHTCNPASPNMEDEVEVRDAAGWKQPSARAHRLDERQDVDTPCAPLGR